MDCPAVREVDTAPPEMTRSLGRAPAAALKESASTVRGSGALLRHFGISGLGAHQATFVVDAQTDRPVRVFQMGRDAVVPVNLMIRSASCSVKRVLPSGIQLTPSVPMNPSRRRQSSSPAPDARNLVSDIL